VLDTLFHALIRYAAPVLVFTAEEIWASRYPDAASVHLLEWPALPELRHSREGGNPSPEPSSQPDGPVMAPRLRGGDEFKLRAKWTDIRTARTLVNEAIEPLRRDKTIGSSLQAEVVLTIRDATAFSYCSSVDLAEICITASCIVMSGGDDSVLVQPTNMHKCGRCWRHLPDVVEDGTLCGRCETVLGDA
jgi:isoleucyl-tRNA synthetase